MSVIDTMQMMHDDEGLLEPWPGPTANTYRTFNDAYAYLNEIAVRQRAARSADHHAAAQRRARLFLRTQVRASP